MDQNKLTTKETEIGRCLIAGMSSTDISEKLEVSVRTIEYYQKKIKTKLLSKNAYQTGYKIGLFLKDETEKG
jgi:DNA-binding NarL/FixJ family response regulator